jgi:mono/diheme cytochrome c family protein
MWQQSGLSVGLSFSESQYSLCLLHVKNFGNRMKKLSQIVVYFCLVLVLSACSFSLAEDITPPPDLQQQSPSGQAQPAAVSSNTFPLLPPNPANGAAVYAENCSPCHGSAGLGDGPQAAQLPNPPAALGSPDLARQSTLAGWYQMVTQGNIQNFMPPFSSLTDGQRWDVVAYAFTLSVPQKTLDQGKQLFQTNCARCHGDTGKGDGPDAAGLANPPQDLTNLEFMATKSENDFFNAITQGAAPDMPAFGDQISESDRWVLAAYVHNLAFAGNAGQVAAETTPVPGASTPASGEITPGAVVTSTGTLSGTQTVGTVTGRVTVSDGGSLPISTTVTLHGFDNMQTAITQTVGIQSDGTFTFSGVPMPDGRVFLVTTSYQGTTYSSDIATVQSGQNNISLPVTVYSTSTDASILSVDRLHLFFDPLDAQTIQVIELYVISNPGAKTIVPAKEGDPVVTFKLPPGATNLQFQDGSLGGRYLQTPDGFGDTVSVRPGSGSYQVLFSFDIPYDKKVDLVQPITLPTNAVVILAPEGTINVKGDQLQDAGSRDVQGAQYHMYNGPAYSPGQELKLTVTAGTGVQGLAIAAGSSSSLLVGVGALGVALIVAGAFLFMRNRARVTPPDEQTAASLPATPSSEGAETVMDAILALDDLYKEGKLPEDAYQQRRAELKARLKELLG